MRIAPRYLLPFTRQKESSWGIISISSPQFIFSIFIPDKPAFIQIGFLKTEEKDFPCILNGAVAEI